MVLIGVLFVFLEHFLKKLKFRILIFTWFDHFANWVVIYSNDKDLALKILQLHKVDPLIVPLRVSRQALLVFLGLIIKTVFQLFQLECPLFSLDYFLAVKPVAEVDANAWQEDEVGQLLSVAETELPG